jgi:hypothetical protein
VGLAGYLLCVPSFELVSASTTATAAAVVSFRFPITHALARRHLYLGFVADSRLLCGLVVCNGNSVLEP